MSKINVSTHDNAASVSLRGTLCFKDIDAFKKVMDLTQNEQLKSIVMDLNHLRHIDEEGLGLLMLLRLRAKQNRQHVAFCRAHGEVKRKFQAYNVKESCS